MKLNTHYFYDETWRANIWLVWPATPATLKKWIEKQFKIPYKNDKSFNGRCLEVVDAENVPLANVIALAGWDVNPKWISVLAHEALHCTDQVLSERGIRLTQDSDEAYTYFHESIMRRCLEFLMK